MRFKVLSVAVMAGLIVTACETATEENASAGGSGNAGSPQVSAVPEVMRSPVTTSRVDQGARPGSIEEFKAEVGDRVFFGFDRFDLTPDARDVLEKQSEWLKRFPNVTVTVTGHTDERGTREYNLALGDRRANSVKSYLVALGIEPNRIRTVSYGKESPVDPRSVEDAWSQNRRGVTVPFGMAISQTN